MANVNTSSFAAGLNASIGMVVAAAAAAAATGGGGGGGGGYPPPPPGAQQAMMMMMQQQGGAVPAATPPLPHVPYAVVLSARLNEMARTLGAPLTSKALAGAVAKMAPVSLGAGGGGASVGSSAFPPAVVSTARGNVARFLAEDVLVLWAWLHLLMDMNGGWAVCVIMFGVVCDYTPPMVHDLSLSSYVR